ncbi:MULTISPECIES: sodium/glutamate symporter [Dermabacter]|uniref:sodium/glutamate symporter n=1 Tax=Dermabacter TaxID=36739 RepID=UPI0008A2CDCE|nr:MULTISPECIES: hypothetical protein [Dermabacter]MCT1806999.1 hypothetical protein [Dermabacter hominis]MDU0937497.1 hypothetical protein [Dermabacter sp.]OFT19887.1 hypothetical protein HMPREF3176_08810 [Dermabacter sp. HMSC08H10]
MSAWDVFTDLGWMGLLILIGVLLRAWVKPIQSLFLPAGLIAGLLGLILGPNVLNIIPFSSSVPIYSSILIAVVFAALPFTSKIAGLGNVFRAVRTMWSVSQAISVLQWGFGLIFALGILSLFFNDLPDGFGLLLAAGFMGGHGTAAAIADGFGNTWPEALSLAMTSATIGIILSVVGGIAIIKVESMRGNTAYLKDFKSLPKDLRTGIIAEENRESIGVSPVSSTSLDPITYHLGLLFMIAAFAYMFTSWANSQVEWLSVPTFSVSFLLGYVVLFVLKAFKAENVFEGKIFERGSGMSTDLLVAFGVASIDPKVVASYWQPLLILILAGTLFVLAYYVFVSKKLFADHKVEQGIFTWGWNTGTAGMGMALLRIVDPDMKSKTLDYYGIAYIPIGFVDIATIATLPALVLAGASWWVALALTLAGAIILALAFRHREPAPTTSMIESVGVHGTFDHRAE